MISAVLVMETAAHRNEKQRAPYLDPYRPEILCIRSTAIRALVQRLSVEGMEAGGELIAKLLLTRHTYALQPDHKDNATHTVNLFVFGHLASEIPSKAGFLRSWSTRQVASPANEGDYRQ
jgi:hypothetical protein